MCKDVKILHYLTSLIIFVWICRLHWSKHNKVSSPSSRIGCSQGLFRCYFGYSVRGLDLVKHLSECQWHFIISPPFHHSPLQSRRKQRPGLITYLFGGMNSNLNCHHFNVFKCFLDCLWIHVLTRSDTLPLERSIADVSSPLLFLKTQRLPSKRRGLYLESQSLEVVEIWTLWVFLKCSHGGPWFAFLVATGVVFLAANRCKSYIMIMI